MIYRYFQQVSIGQVAKQSQVRALNTGGKDLERERRNRTGAKGLETTGKEDREQVNVWETGKGVGDRCSWEGQVRAF